MLGSPAWAEGYGDNMLLEEYIVGLAALVLVVWDITRRYMPSSVEGASASGPSASASMCAKLRDSEAWTRIRETILDHPFEASVLVCSFATLVFARVPFSLSAVLVGVVTWYSLVLGARIASQPIAVKPAAPVTVVARPVRQATIAAPVKAEPEAVIAEAAPHAEDEPAAPNHAAAPRPAPAAKAETPAPASRRRTGAAGSSSSRRPPAKPKA
jgi:hypothetical protein